MAVDEDSLPVGTTTERLDTTKITQADGTAAHREAVKQSIPVIPRIEMFDDDEETFILLLGNLVT